MALSIQFLPRLLDIQYIGIITKLFVFKDINEIIYTPLSEYDIKRCIPEVQIINVYSKDEVRIKIKDERDLVLYFS